MHRNTEISPMLRLAVAVLLLAAVCTCNAMDSHVGDTSLGFLGVSPMLKLRGGGIPQFWVNQDDLKNAPGRWKGGIAKLRAMCTGSQEGTSENQGKASRLAGLLVLGIMRACGTVEVFGWKDESTSTASGCRKSFIFLVWKLSQHGCDLCRLHL